jgi:hypothetical protein
MTDLAKEGRRLEVEPENAPRNDDGRIICTICLVPIGDDYEILVETECHHFFGSICLQRWLEGNGARGSCPNCRNPSNPDAVTATDYCPGRILYDFRGPYKTEQNPQAGDHGGGLSIHDDDNSW